MIEKNIRILLDEIKKSKGNPIITEYLYELLYNYIQGKKEKYKEVLKEYDEKELNEILKASYENYKKRATKLFIKEMIYLSIYLVLVALATVFFVKNISIISMILLTSLLLFVIFRSVAFKNNLKNETDAEIKKNISDDLIKLEERLKNERDI